MEKRPLGNTGILVSPLGLGTVKLGRDSAVKYDRPFTIPDDAAARRLLDRAMQLGINLVDTAPAYGVSEERLGSLLAGQRDRWIICTKAGEEFEGGRSSFDFSPAAIRASVERSLRRLRTGCVDVVLLHSSGEDEWIIQESGAIEELERLKAQGKLRAFGASTKSPAGAMLAVDRCEVVMLTISAHETGDVPAASRAAERGVGVLVKKALGSGRLAQAGEGRSGGNAIEAAFRAAFSPAGVSSVIVGTINPAHLEANANALANVLSRTIAANSSGPAFLRPRGGR